ncbi:MAG: DUF2062 domain-containing protein [Candidatus Cloacimonetes bacterium]|nr:DUF2062 domain-containing protein [Candidatus Cloacimonadota bacterium]
MINPMKRAVRLKYLQLLRLNDNPHSIALGFAIGIASGALPVMGIQTIVALPFVLLLRCNVLGMAIGVWWTNPVTFIPIYYSEYLLGTLLGSYPRISFETFSNQLSVIKDFEGLQNLGGAILIPMALGAIVYAVILGPLSYFGIKRVLEARRARRREKRAKREALKAQSS